MTLVWWGSSSQCDAFAGGDRINLNHPTPVSAGGQQLAVRTPGDVGDIGPYVNRAENGARRQDPIP